MSNLFEVRPVNLETFGSENGIYLETIEIQNWGPFSGRWKIPLKELPSLFVGENGTGKSSLMDAILTLLVSKKYLHYNNASDSKGGKAGERKLFEYVRGFKESSRGEDLYKTVEYLREPGEISVILLRFCVNVKYCTIAHVFMVKETTDVPAFYLYKEGILSIDDFPTNADSFEKYRSMVSKMYGVSVTSDLSKYFSFVRENLSLDTNGMRLLASLSSQKDLKDVSKVIREYMFLDKNDFRNDYEETKRTLEEIKFVINNLKELRNRDTILEKTVPAIKKGREFQKELLLWQGCKDKITAYMFRCAKDTGVKELDTLKEKEETVKNKKKRLEKEWENKNRAQMELEIEKENKGGSAIKQKEAEIKILEEQLNRMNLLTDDYVSGLKEIGLPNNVSNEQSFKKVQTLVKKEISEVTKLQSEAVRKLDDAKSETDKAVVTVNQLNKNLRDLEQRKIAIHPDLVRVRDNFCTLMNVDSSTMPFLGEYLSVDDPEWLPALENLFNSDSKSFLVPEIYKKEVSEFFDKRRKENKRSGLDVRYILMTTVNTARISNKEEAWRKISVRSDMPYSDWVESYIQKAGNCVCCETNEEFQYEFPAIMKSGLRRLNSQRHVIDERKNINDPRNFVMSGSYDARRKILLRDIEDAEEAKKKAQKKIVEASKTVKELEHKSEVLGSLPRFKSYAEIDTVPVTEKLKECKDVLQTLMHSKDLEKMNEKINQIKIRLEEISTDKENVEKEIEASHEAVVRVETKLKEGQELLNKTVFDAEEEKILGMVYDKRKPTAKNPKYETIMASASWVTRDINEKVNELGTKKNESCKEAESLMRKYLEEYISRRNELKPTMYEEGEAEKFIEEYDRVHDEWLPDALKKMQDVKLFGEDTALRSFIVQMTHDVDDSIRKIIDKINDTLHRVPYSHDINPTYLDVSCKRSRNSRINELREKLDNVANCMGQEEKQEDLLNHFAALMEFIEENIDKNKSGKATDNILDVRNWFEYPVAECRYNEETGELYHIKELDEVAKQSGGEGVKLTYFVMAACYSMWMHIFDEDYAGNTFRFLMIDEIDTKISPSNLQDVITLFYLLGIQLVSLLPIGDKVSQYEGFVGNIVCTGFLKKPESYIDTISYTEYMNRNKEIITERLKLGKDIFNGQN